MAEQHVHSDSLAVIAGNTSADSIVRDFVTRLLPSGSEGATDSNDQTASDQELLKLGLAALDAFLQANVTGPVLPSKAAAEVERQFAKAWKEISGLDSGLEGLRKACLADLEVDGVAPYAYIPHIELFGLARHIVNYVLPSKTSETVIELPSGEGTTKHNLAWSRLRINSWHYKLITQPSLGHGSNFTRSSQWSDIPTLAARIVDGIDAVTKQVLNEEVWATNEAETWSKDDKTLFLVEAANYHILLGRNDLAKETLAKAGQTSGLQYALSGALGKKTKFQEKSTSQLVVLAKSSDDSAPTAKDDEEGDSAKPDALKLNDDTLLEDIHFTKDGPNGEDSKTSLPSSLTDLKPDEQPQLSPLDQIILLTEATMKDAFSPVDTLTSEEILPYAVRVLADKSTNWQIYTQALLVRSRIEVHRSRTLERGVLQLQAVADQVIADTTAEASAPPPTEEEPSDVPAIQVNDQPPQEKPTSFLPAPKPTESAPAHTRLAYIHALSTPPRWHLESELAYAWAGIGSLASALEIFKRLRLWAEVALCLASRAAVEDEDGRGSGGESKAKGIIRWRLFHQTDTTEPVNPDDEKIDDITSISPSTFSGPERTPPPPNAARLWCILGDLESQPAHYERAWSISNNRYSRAQKSLGEHYLSQKDWTAARDAYVKATSINRLDPDMWSRLGDISLRLGNFEDAAEAYSRSISSATDTLGGEGAKTWSNLGSALWSLYCEVTAPEAQEKPASEDTSLALESTISRDPSKLIAQSLSAYKKGATIAHDNWRIWDNVLTLSARIRPPAVPDMVLATKHILRIRQSENVVDVDVLSALLTDVVLQVEKEPHEGIYEPKRGTQERLVARLIEEEIVPIITHRSALWTLAAKLRVWRSDYVGAIEATERAWRVATTSPSSSSLLPNSESAGEGANWTENKQAWEEVVQRTDELASMLENYGPRTEGVGAKWKGKVRSAVRTVMGKGRENWEGSEGWKMLEAIMEGLKTAE